MTASNPKRPPANRWRPHQMGPDNMHCRVLKKLAGVGVEPLYPIGKLMACEIPSD